MANSSALVSNAVTRSGSGRRRSYQTQVLTATVDAAGNVDLPIAPWAAPVVGGSIHVRTSGTALTGSTNTVTLDPAEGTVAVGNYASFTVAGTTAPVNAHEQIFESLAKADHVAPGGTWLLRLGVAGTIGAGPLVFTFTIIAELMI